jgi:hypothetical protein
MIIVICAVMIAMPLWIIASELNMIRKKNER